MMDERKKRPTDGLRKRVERERDEKRAMMMGGMEWQERERANEACRCGMCAAAVGR